MLRSAVPFANLTILYKKLQGQNHFAEAKPTCFDFSSSNFLWQGQILSTSGAALRKSCIEHHDIQHCSFNQNQISMKFAEKSIFHNNKN
jgi:hypothetical protein